MKCLSTSGAANSRSPTNTHKLVRGGILGSYLGVRWFSNRYLQQLLAVILLIVVIRASMALVM